MLYQESKPMTSNNDQCGSSSNSRKAFGARGSAVEHRDSSVDKRTRREWKKRATNFSSTSVYEAGRVVNGRATDETVSNLGGGRWQQMTTTAAGQDNGERGGNHSVADKGVLRGLSAAVASGALPTPGSLSHDSSYTTPAKEGEFRSSPRSGVSEHAGNASQSEPGEAGGTDQIGRVEQTPLFGIRQDSQDRGNPSNSSTVDVGDRNIERSGVHNADDRGELTRRQIDQALRERALRRRRRFGHFWF